MTRLSPRRAWAESEKKSAALLWIGCVPRLPCAGSTGHLQRLSGRPCRPAPPPPLIARRDTESLQLVLKLADEENRRQIALACSKSGWSEGAALTLGGQRPRRQKTYDFDDL